MFAETMYFFVFFTSSSSVIEYIQKKSLLKLTNIVCIKNSKTRGSWTKTGYLHNIDACLFFLQFRCLHCSQHGIRILVSPACWTAV